MDERMETTIVALTGTALALALGAVWISRTLPGADVRLLRPLGILAGAMFGVATGIFAALILNPITGLAAGTFFNLAALGLGLGFLGFITGALGGLLYSGMILARPSRTTETATSTVDAPDDGSSALRRAFAGHLARATGQPDENHNVGGGR